MVGSGQSGDPETMTSQSDTLLIVEDNTAVSAALRDYLKRRGWTVVLTAPDADTGVRLAAENEPGAIVLDNRMPDRDGIDVLAELRRSCPGARIVLHTTEDTIDLRDEAERLGADAIVAKGIPLDQLAELLRDH
jgi:DNA-binding NarL/FixJ family response regulator